MQLWLETEHRKVETIRIRKAPPIRHSNRDSARRRTATAPAPESARTDARLSHIVRVLADHATLVVSGTKLAEELGASRSEVWRLIEQLRSLGVAIAGHPTEGYRLLAVPDLLLPENLDPLISGTIFSGKIRHHFQLPSTNTAAMQAAHDGEPEGAVFIAEQQSAGRGRGGHDWHSEQGLGIYLSAVLRPRLAPADAIVMSLAAGLAVVSAVEEVTGVRPDLRWPNDVLIATPEGDKKFCGILTEMNAEATRVRYVVVGIGINVNHELFPPDLAPIATSLRIAAGREWSRVDVAAALLRSLDHEYRNLASRTQILRRFEQASSYARGCRVHVEEEGGYVGITDGLDERGFLRIRTDEGVRTVISGGVRKVQ